MPKLFNFKPYLKNKRFLLLAGLSLAFLAASLVVNLYAGQYADSRESNAVTDLILSNIRVYDVDIIFVYGILALIFLILFLSLAKLNCLPFIASSIALFVLIRSGFIILTHIAPFPTHVIVDPTGLFSGLFNKFSFTSDLFFSGHTGLPYLMALVFWQDKFWRYFFIALAAFFGVVVLMGHLHYSIDVLAAFFITYSIYHLAVTFFQPQKKLFDQGL